MTYAIIHHFPGGTKANYEASVAAVHPGPNQLPKGQIAHIAGAVPGGWTIVAVHESKENWEQFRDGTLLPKLTAGIEGGFPTPPEETAIDVYTVLPSREGGSVTFAPIAPTTTVAPTKIAGDTYVIHQVQPALGQPLFVYINSMVILGKEPVIVDTGTPANRKQWLDDVFSLVEPEDVHWIFLSHDDVDHAGNLDEALSACPNAKLVCNWAMVERHTNCFDFPLERCHWVVHGETFDVGDRALHALRPPVFDSPTTRGLYDPTTGVYWAVDTFATPLPDPCMTIADLDQDFWFHGMWLFALGAVSPWLTMLDTDKYGKYVDRVQSLDITTIASCHSPVIEGPYIEQAFGRLRELPTLDAPTLPDQSILDQIVSATSIPRS